MCVNMNAGSLHDDTSLWQLAAVATFTVEMMKILNVRE